MRGAEVQRRLDSPGRGGQEAQPTRGPWLEPPELVSMSERRSGGGSGVGPCCIVHPNKLDHYSMRFIVAGPSNGRVCDVCSLWRRVSVAPGVPRQRSADDGERHMDERSWEAASETTFSCGIPSKRRLERGRR